VTVEASDGLSDGLSVIVRDTGVGIAAERLPRPSWKGSRRSTPHALTPVG
jgi:hypothetical protein